jgi:RHS repeat-associated protein
MTPILFVEYESIDADPVSGKRYFIFSDHLGSPVLVEDDDGKVIWQARLDPYGAAHIRGKAAMEMPLRFPGHYFDPETGLHYNRFRYYSPELGRYLQSDPLGVAGGVNLYGYTRNPLKQVDVRGDTCPTDESNPEENPNGRTAEDRADPEGTTSPTGESAKPRVVPMDEAVATVRQSLDNAGVGKGKVKAYGVSVHQDGSVTVALSGNDKTVQSAQRRMDLPENYNHAPVTADRTGFEPPPPAPDGTQYNGDSSTCVEPRLAQGERENGSPVVERTDNPVWRGEPGDNPYPRGDGTTMEPCPSCAHNGDKMH